MSGMAMRGPQGGTAGTSDQTFAVWCAAFREGAAELYGQLDPTSKAVVGLWGAGWPHAGCDPDTRHSGRGRVASWPAGTGPAAGQWCGAPALSGAASSWPACDPDQRLSALGYEACWSYNLDSPTAQSQISPLPLGSVRAFPRRPRERMGYPPTFLPKHYTRCRKMRPPADCQPE
ncbi:unnamed protein product [Boreogadus saida]